MTFPARPAPAGSAWRALLAAAFAAGLLLSLAVPAGAVNGHGISSPSDTVRGGTQIVAFVDASALETIDTVRVRITGNGRTYGPELLSYRDGPLSGGRSYWRGSIDPMAPWGGGGAMPNGTYRIEAQVQSKNGIGQAQPPTEWKGRDVVFDVPPPKPSASAKVVNQATRAVEISWSAVSLPDFRRYVVQRRPGNGSSWSKVAELDKASVTKAADTAPSDGEWVYRVAVARAGGAGGEKVTYSDERKVSIAAPLPSDPTDPGGGDDPGSGDDPGDGDGDGDGGSGDGGSGDGGDNTTVLTPRRPGENSNAGAPGDDSAGQSDSGNADRAGGQVPQIRRQSTNSAPAPRSQRRAGPGTNMFERYLPYDLSGRDNPTEAPQVAGPDGGVPETETETGTEDGRGLLTIANRQVPLEEVLPPFAGGLLLFVLGGHVLRVARQPQVADSAGVAAAAGAPPKRSAPKSRARPAAPRPARPDKAARPKKAPRPRPPR